MNEFFKQVLTAGHTHQAGSARIAAEFRQLRSQGRASQVVSIINQMAQLAAKVGVPIPTVILFESILARCDMGHFDECRDDLLDRCLADRSQLDLAAILIWLARLKPSLFEQDFDQACVSEARRRLAAACEAFDPYTTLSEGPVVIAEKVSRYGCSVIRDAISTEELWGVETAFRLEDDWWRFLEKTEGETFADLIRDDGLGSLIDVLLGKDWIVRPDQCVLRKVGAKEDTFLEYHQDAAILPSPTDFLTCWTCKETTCLETPQLDVVPFPFSSYLPFVTRSRGNTEGYFSRDDVVGDDLFKPMTMKPGDVVVMRNKVVHRTHPLPVLSDYRRTSVDFRVYAAA
ncbi:MAG: hypothetical protein ACPGOV_12390 [Magnetovibrionaceae bacterium]